MKKIKVVMLKSLKGSDRCGGGFPKPVKSYLKGEGYELGEELAKSFIGSKAAEKSKEEISIEPPADDDLDPEKNKEPEKKKGFFSK